MMVDTTMPMESNAAAYLIPTMKYQFPALPHVAKVTSDSRWSVFDVRYIRFVVLLVRNVAT
jgi:hypothetical protein